MLDIELGEVQAAFADIIWAHEPVGSGELVKLSRTELGWQKSTTYTVLKKLCDKGYFRNEGGVVSSRISREQAEAAESRGYVADRFGGSLPAFLTAFTAGRRLTQEEADGLRRMIEAYEEGGES